MAQGLSVSNLKALGFEGGLVGEFTNPEHNSERFNDYVNNKVVGAYNHAEGEGNVIGEFDVLVVSSKDWSIGLITH